jgi:pimeloyl-ACP methyl ester carboxylesterase
METLYTQDIKSGSGIYALMQKQATWPYKLLYSFILFGLAACIPGPATEVPIPSISTADAASLKHTLIVMLPGMGDRIDSFQTRGFLDTQDDWDFDIVAVDAHVGYYRERSLVTRLRGDVIDPAKANGYQDIWLLGVSMGGFGSLLYAAQHPADISGVILLAPYLGEPEIAREVAAAGGLNSWQGNDAVGRKAFETAIWLWLKEATASPGGTPVILGFGRADKLVKGYGPLIEALAPSRVYSINGGHKWTAWSPLWARIAADFKQFD